MNKFYLRIIFVATITVLTPSPGAEELIARGDGRYISTRSKAVAVAEENVKVQIQSVSGLSGRIEIVADRVSEAGFEFRKLIKAADEKTAEQYAGLVSVVIESQPGVVRLLLKAPNPGPWGGTDNAVQIEGKLIVPLHSRLDIDCQYYDFSITGPLAEVSAKPSFGRYQLSDISEKVNLITTGGNISARDLKGDIIIKGEKADLRVSGITADKQARIANKGGDITMSDISGNIEVQNDYGKIKIDRARADEGHLKIFGEFCPIDLELASLDNARIIINNKNDNIKITLPDISSVTFNLSVGADSEIHVSKIPVLPGRIKPKYMELTAGDGRSVISADIKGVGDIIISGAK